MFLKYKVPPETEEDKDVDLCANRDTGTRELLPHQKIVRDYLSMETPYRGLLLYHGLGSGKTCSSIAVGESLLTTKNIYVFLPASLKQNYVNEIQTCGAPIYMYDHHWRKQALNDESRETAKALGISEAFIDRSGGFFVSVPGEEPNYTKLSKSEKDIIAAQFEDVIKRRFNFISYNGLSSSNIAKYVPEDGTNPYSDSVVIIDEVHNFISRVINESEIAGKLYERLYTATNCKVVALSGTPVINRPNEIAYLMNLLRGPIERYVVPVKSIVTWDEEKMKNVLRAIPDIDTIEFNSLKKYLLVTRNPQKFRTVYNENGERIAVQYTPDMPHIELAVDWVSSWKSEFETGVGGAELAAERTTVEKLECLPTDFEEFAAMFLEGLQIKNPGMLSRRIQGLVSYFKGADDRMLPKVVDTDKMLHKVEMSSQQFNFYLTARFEEIKANKKKATIGTSDNEMKMFRVNSRLACNYAIPPDLRAFAKEEAKAEYVGSLKEGEKLSKSVYSSILTKSKELILEKLRAEPDRYLSQEALKQFSPKMLEILKSINEDKWKNQFLYSQYQSLEGLGLMSAILDHSGWQRFRIKKGDTGQWTVDGEMNPEKPAYAMFVGGTGENDVERELLRQIFNGRYEPGFPPSLKDAVESLPKKLLCLFMASSAGAEGITLLNVRHVHIMEPHWNPARHEQVIGRAVRICSHARLPMEERTVRVSFYVSVFTDTQAKSTEEASNVVAVRRTDMVMKQYEKDPVETFMSTDEYLYEISYEKEVVNKRISNILKQSAVDCEVHRKLHSRDQPVTSCMRFDSTSTNEDLAFKPSIGTEDTDETVRRNTVKRHRRLQKVSVKGIVFYFDPTTGDLFDNQAFEDNNRLLRVGVRTAPTQIKWILV
jgi:hypothetical protein